MEWFQKGAEAGGPKSQLNLGKLLIESKDPANIDEGIKWLQAAVDQKQPIAAEILGTIYFLGQYNQKIDYRRAFDCLFISAEAGNANSQNLVGFIYSKPYLGQTHEREAENWFRKAASAGSVKAMSNLGSLLWKKPNADSQTRIEALKWLLVAQVRGEVTAEKTLSDLSMAINTAELAEAQRLAYQPQADPLKQPKPENQ
jgi:TPR repeat protein